MKKIFRSVAGVGAVAAFAILVYLIAPAGFITAAQLKEARVTQIINDVKLLPVHAAPRPAAVSDTVSGGAVSLWIKF